MGYYKRKYADDAIVQVRCCCEMPGTELDIMIMYANGMSMPEIQMETGTDRKTIAGIIRRNLKSMLQKAFK